jgi:hypothetical protein
MYGRDQLKPGMVVRSQGGEKLGTVQSIGADSFHIERGRFFRKDYLVLLSEIQDIRDSEIILSIPKSALKGTATAPGVGTEPERERGAAAAVGARYGGHEGERDAGTIRHERR